MYRPEVARCTRCIRHSLNFGVGISVLRTLQCYDVLLVVDPHMRDWQCGVQKCTLIFSLVCCLRNSFVIAAFVVAGNQEMLAGAGGWTSCIYAILGHYDVNNAIIVLCLTTNLFLSSSWFTSRQREVRLPHGSSHDVRPWRQRPTMIGRLKLAVTQFHTTCTRIVQLSLINKM